MLTIAAALLLGQLGSPVFEAPPPSAVSPSGAVSQPLSPATDGGTVSVAGPLSVTSATTTHGLVSQALATPGAPTVTNVGTAGSTTDTYAVQATIDLLGVLATVDSATTSTTTANATLSSTNYNAISWTAVPGAQCYLVRRTAAGGTPSTTGVIATVCGGALSYNDTGAAGDGSGAPTVDTSASIFAGGLPASGMGLSVKNGAGICLTGDSPCTGYIYRTGSAVGAIGLGFGGSTAYFDSIADWSGSAPLNLTHNAGTKIGSSGTAVKNHLSGACTPSAGVCTQIADTSAAATSACLATSTATGGTSPCYCTVAAGTGFTPTCPGTTTAPISYVIEDQ